MPLRLCSIPDFLGDLSVDCEKAVLLTSTANKNKIEVLKIDVIGFAFIYLQISPSLNPKPCKKSLNHQYDAERKNAVGVCPVKLLKSLLKCGWS